MSKPHVAIIGAGPAGLTAGYLLSKYGHSVTVFEADPTYVGGISRTVEYKGFLFDIGGHRFFSKSTEVENLWTELLPDDLLVRPRSSRIFYRGKFFSYPLKAADALVKLGIGESMLCVASYGVAKLGRLGGHAPKNFEEWVSRQFGNRLYRIFFKTYTEKVWGMDCKEISADWAAQRIKGLSLGTAILHATGLAGRKKSKASVVKTLIDSFRYPRKGPGMMWEAAARKIREMGNEVRMATRVTGLERAPNGTWKIELTDAQGDKSVFEADQVISTAPIRELVNGLRPKMSDAAIEAANHLRYRDFLIVALMIKEREAFDDNWLYIHDPSVKVGRIQNFKSWSPEMVPDPSLCCYGFEYFCFDKDRLWSSSDAELIEMAKSELAKLGLGKAEDVIDACVVRQKKAYPVYDAHYAERVEMIRKELAERFPGLHLVGRNGMHKYNNQDHAMMTAMLTVENIVAGRQVYDVWRVNQDAEYHEDVTSKDLNAVSGLRGVPRPVSETPS